jgi:phosphopantetheine adenylyltransferase
MQLFPSFDKLIEQYTAPVREVIALYPGGFKPPTKGHYNALNYLLQTAGSAKVFVGKKERGGINAEQSCEIWNIYKKYLGKAVDIAIAEITPIKSVYDFADTNKDKDLLVGAGAEDQDRFDYFKKHIEKYPFVNIVNIPPQNNRISGTVCREKIQNRDMNCVDYFVPEVVSPEDRQKIVTILLL